MKVLCILAIIFPASLAALDPFSQHSSDFEIALKVAIGGLVSAVVSLFFWFRASYKRIERKLDERDKQREKLFGKIAKLQAATRMLARCPSAGCPYQGVNLDNEDEEDEA